MISRTTEQSEDRDGLLKRQIWWSYTGDIPIYAYSNADPKNSLRLAELARQIRIESESSEEFTKKIYDFVNCAFAIVEKERAEAHTKTAEMLATEKQLDRDLEALLKMVNA